MRIVVTRRPPGRALDMLARAGEVWLWEEDRPIPRECPECGSPFLVEKVNRNGVVVRCPKKECGYREAVE